MNSKALNVSVALCAFSLLTLFASCGSNSPAPAAGVQAGTDLCDQNFVSDFNTVNHSFPMILTDALLDKSESLINDFSAKYKNVICKADLKEDGKLDSVPAVIDSNAEVTKWKTSLSSERNRLHPANPSQSITVQPPQTNVSAVILDSEQELKFSDLNDGVEIKILNAALFNQLLKMKESLVVQNGKASDTSNLMRDQNVCFVAGGIYPTEVKDGDNIRLTRIKVQGAKLEMTSVEATFGIGCVKRKDKSTAWSIGDFNAVFANILSVKPYQQPSISCADLFKSDGLI